MKITSKHKAIYLLKTSDKKNMLKVTTELETLLFSPGQIIHPDTDTDTDTDTHTHTHTHIFHLSLLHNTHTLFN